MKAIVALEKSNRDLSNTDRTIRNLKALVSYLAIISLFLIMIFTLYTVFTKQGWEDARFLIEILGALFVAGILIAAAFKLASQSASIKALVKLLCLLALVGISIYGMFSLGSILLSAPSWALAMFCLWLIFRKK